MGQRLLAWLSGCIVLLACALFGTPSIYANTSTLGKPSIRLFWPKDYGEHPQNWSIKVGPEGHIYVGNSGGIIVYDGVRWEFLETPGGKSWVAELDFTVDGRIILGTRGDFGYFEADRSAKWRYVSVSSQHQIPGLGMVTRVVQHPLGAFYSTREDVYWHTTDGDIKQYEAPKNFGLYNILDQIYIADIDGLQRFDFELEEFKPAIDGGQSPPGKDIFGLVVLADGSLILATERDALFRVNSRQLTPYETAVDSWMRTNLANSIFPLDDGRLIVSSRDDGLVVLGENGELLRHIGTAEGLPWPRIWGIAQDHQGGIWVACEGGIARIDLDSGITYFSDGTRIQGAVEAIAEYAGNLFAATARGLAVLKSAAVGESAKFVAWGKQGNSHRSMLDVGTELLVGDDLGIYSLSFSDIDSGPQTRRVYQGRTTVHMIRSRVDSSLVYAAVKDGVVRLRRADNGWVSAGKLDGVSQHIRFVAEDDQGVLWASTARQTVYRVTDTALWPNSTVQVFAGESGLPDSKIHIFRIDGELVFDSNFGAYQFHDGRFSRDPRFLWENSMHTARQIGDEVWTTWGILRFDNTLNAYQLDSRPYRLFPFGTITSIYATPNTVWLGGDTGIYRVEPDKYEAPSVPQHLSIRSISDIGGKSMFFGGATGDYASQAFTLQSDQTDLRFLYALADYATPEKTRYRSRLLGLNDQWSPWTSETQTDFTNLPGGDFQFELQAKDASEQVTSVVRFAFAKQRYWYLTLWAIMTYVLILILLFGASAYYGQRWRTRRLEAIIEVRTETIRQQKEELQEMSDAKSRFFANVSHEFRTPLTLTIGPLDDLISDRDIGLSGEARRYVELARDNARRSLGLLGEILDINRLEADRLRLHIREYDLALLARTATERFEDHAQRNQVMLRLEGVAEVVLARFDQDQMDRCLSNLLSNAIKFTPPGGEICVSLEKGDEALELSVEDNGQGIDATDVPLVFDRYYQGKNSSQAQPGTGIGLALVKELMALHGGSVSVTSTPAHGSCFSLHLPLDLALSGFDDVPTVTAQTSAEKSHLTDEGVSVTKTLLVVDDNAELREFLRMRLCTQYRILEASDGIEALQVVGEELPDVIISDVMMPNMDGMALTRALKQDPQFEHIPLLLLTAKDTKRDTVEGLQSGANDYLAKPFDTSELIARIAGLLAHQQRLRRHLRLELQQAALELKPRKQRFAESFEAAVSRRLADGAIEIDQLAEELCVERSTLFRRVEKHFNCTPQQFIRQKRLELAAQLLRAGRGSVSEIAYAVGFESLNYFSRCYRQSFGQAPSQDLRAGG